MNEKEVKSEDEYTKFKNKFKTKKPSKKKDEPVLHHPSDEDDLPEYLGGE